MSENTTTDATAAPDWRHVAAFLGLTFGLTWLLNLAIVEEGLVLQSMFDPALFNAGDLGGRWLGVNWVWSEWTIGYHIIWSISIPILLAELLFPARRYQPWLGRLGIGITGVLYALGALALAAIERLFITPDFRVPIGSLVGAALLAGALVVLALRWPSAPPVPRMHLTDAPSPCLVGVVAPVSSAVWFGLLHLPRVLQFGALVLLPMVVALALASGIVALIWRWSANRDWTNWHRLALACGAITTSSLMPILPLVRQLLCSRWHIP